MHCLIPVDPASITAPAVDTESLIDRERLVRGGQVMFTCENEDIPAPAVRWYHNGEPIQPDNGVSVNGNQVVISEPQVSNSGVYQCVVSNTIDGVVMEDMRQWVLEVREPGKRGRRVLLRCNQCVVSNTIDGAVMEEVRQWVSGSNTIDRVHGDGGHEAMGAKSGRTK